MLFIRLSEFCAKKLKILRTIFANSVHLFQVTISTLRLSVALLYDSDCHNSICAQFYLVCSFVLHFYV